MSKTILKGIAAYLQRDLVEELDGIRGDIPRSRILERAMKHYIDDVRSGKIALLPGVGVGATHQAATASTDITNPEGGDTNG